MAFWKELSNGDNIPDENKMYWLVIKQTNSSLPYVIYKQGLFDGVVWKTYEYGDIDNNNPIDGYSVLAFAEIYNYPDLGDTNCDCPTTIKEFVFKWIRNKFSGD